MATIPSITTWTNGQVLTSTALNGNFATIRDALVARGLFTDEARTVSAVLTFSTAPVFSNAQTFAAGVVVTTGGVTVSAGGITVTGASVITGALTGLTDVTASGTVTGGTFSGSGASLTNLPAANLTGTLPAISGANLTALNATNIASGTLNAARLPTLIDAILPSTFSAKTVSSAADDVTLLDLSASGNNGAAFGFASNLVEAQSATFTFSARLPADLDGESGSVVYEWVRIRTANGIGYMPMVRA